MCVISSNITHCNTLQHTATHCNTLITHKLCDFVCYLITSCCIVRLYSAATKKKIKPQNNPQAEESPPLFFVKKGKIAPHISTVPLVNMGSKMTYGWGTSHILLSHVPWIWSCLPSKHGFGRERPGQARYSSPSLTCAPLYVCLRGKEEEYLAWLGRSRPTPCLLRGHDHIHVWDMTQ